MLALGGIGDGVPFWISQMTTLLARLATPAASWTSWSVTGTLPGRCCTSQVFSMRSRSIVSHSSRAAFGAFCWSQPQTSKIHSAGAS